MREGVNWEEASCGPLPRSEKNPVEGWDDAARPTP